MSGKKFALIRMWELCRFIFNRLLHTYFLMSRSLTLGVRAIVRSEDGRFLLVRHIYTPGWHFPGGGVERGDTAEYTLDKELYQETGLKRYGQPVLHGVFYNQGVSKRDHVIVYNCKVEGTLLARPACMEIAEAGYFDYKDLPYDTDPGTLRRMREIVDGTMPSVTW